MLWALTGNRSLRTWMKERLSTFLKILYPLHFEMRSFNAQIARNLNVLIEKNRSNTRCIVRFFD